jgi:RimJ/RimL family protein N-acetyltransferase
MSTAPLAPCDVYAALAATSVVLRALEPEDGDLLVDVFARMSPRSRELRFLAPKHRLTESDLRQLTAVDHLHHEAVAALSVEDGRPVGIARFVRDQHDPEVADVAVSVVDAWQGQGVGTLLAAALAERAQEVGITRFNAVMLPDNEAAVRLMHRTAGDVERVALDHNGAEFVITLAPPKPSRSHLLKGV